MVSLQVRGSNQLHKEINQTHTIDDKVIFGEALHRNEMTGEQEGEEAPSKRAKKRGPVGMSMAIQKIKPLSPELAKDSSMASIVTH